MAMGAPLPMLHTVKVKRTKKSGRIKIENIPPEEFLISKSARDIQDAPFVAHRRLIPRGELLEMGYDKDVVESLAAYNDLEFNEERVARYPRGEQPDQEHTIDFAMQPLEVYECYIRIDLEGDGYPKLWKVTNDSPIIRVE